MLEAKLNEAGTLKKLLDGTSPPPPNFFPKKNASPLAHSHQRTRDGRQL